MKTNLGSPSQFPIDDKQFQLQLNQLISNELSRPVNDYLPSPAKNQNKILS
jgi:hypothetical protein